MIEKLKNRKKKLDGKNKMKTNLAMLPSIVGVLIFFIIPFIVVLYYSVIDNIVQKKFVFLDNYIKVLNNEAFKLAALNTAKFTLIAVPLAVVLSMLLASLMMNNLPFKSQFRTLFLTPLMVPVASVVLIFQVLFHYNGVVNDFIA